MRKNQTKVVSEQVKVFWRFAYVRLFDDHGLDVNDKYVSTDDGEYVKLTGRLYWMLRKW